MISGSCDCLTPVEFGAVGPDAMQNGRHFACDGNFGFLRTNAFSELSTPAFERRSAPDNVEQHIGGLEQVVPRQPVAAFGDASCTIEFAGLVASRRKSQIGSNIARALEPVWIINGADERKRRDRTDTGDGHQPADRGIGFGQSFDLIVIRKDLGDQRRMNQKQRVDKRPQVRCLLQDNHHFWKPSSSRQSCRAGCRGS